MAQSTPVKRWLGTKNNPTDDDQKPNMAFEGKFKYIVWGNEVAPTTGTPHWQIYVELKVKVRLSTMVATMCNTHWVPCNGKPKECSDYCKKEGDFHEFGELSKETGGEREKCRWAEIHDLAKKNKKGAFFSDHPQVSFLHPMKFDSLVKYYRPTPQALASIDARWYYGEAGTGKSKTARHEFPDLYLKPTSTKWWPDYDFQETVLIDDLNVDAVYVLVWLKNWADHYPFQAETKGSHTSLIRPKRIIVTSNYTWDQMTTDLELRKAIARRFKVRQFLPGTLDQLMMPPSPPLIPTNPFTQSGTPFSQASTIVLDDEWQTQFGTDYFTGNV